MDILGIRTYIFIGIILIFGTFIFLNAIAAVKLFTIKKENNLLIDVNKRTLNELTTLRKRLEKIEKILKDVD